MTSWELWNFRENSIVVSIPFTRVQVEENPQVIPHVMEDEADRKRAEHILEFCCSPRGVLEIAELLGYKDRKTVRKYVKPLVEQGRLAMTIPDKPNSSNQKYVTIK